MKHTIYVRNKSVSHPCLENKSLMDTLSVHSDVVPKGCHNGACGVCRIKVHSGEYEILKMNKKHISQDDENNNIVLGCRVLPRGDMDIEFLPKKSISDKPKVYVLGS